MRFLRTTSTARLLALVLGVIIVAAGTAAIALAATSGAGPKPPPKPLARAIHDALGAPKVAGVTARVKFTNHLIDSSAVSGSNPLLTGGSGRLWATTNGKLRIELQSQSGDVQVVSDGKSFLVYDGTSNTAYRGQLPQGKPARPEHKEGGPPSIAQIQKALTHLSAHATFSRAIPSDVAGRPAYQVRVTPKGTSSLLSGAQLAWDAIRGVPLEIGVYARGDSSPVLALSVTSISYGPVHGSVFKISPPKGAHIVDLTPRRVAPAGKGGHKEVTGLHAVQRALPFKLSAPKQLVGDRLRDVKQIGRGALLSYGRGLDALLVIEKQTSPGNAAPTLPSGHHENGLSLPTVSVNGTTGQELPTALGTVVRFTREGVEYTVLASKPAATVIAAARSL